MMKNNLPRKQDVHETVKLSRRPIVFWLIIIVAILIFILIIWRIYLVNKRSFKPSKSIAVVTTNVKRMNVPVYLKALGSVTPTDSVTVRTQVNGRLMRINFREGQTVKAGQLLAEIDPRPFEAQLLQFTGQLERDRAQLTNARIDLKRYKLLYPIGGVSKQVYDTQKALVQQLEGTVESDQGQISMARINLGYSYITSPINGRIGLYRVDPGNFVQTTDPDGIAVINTIQPITIIFSIPEDDVPKVLQQLHAGKQLRVEAYDRTQNQLLGVGTLLTIDNQIDPTTGTVKLKALFNNENENLFPDQFVNIKLLVTVLPNVTIVPTTAIQYGQQGTFVFLLQSNQTVALQNVTTGISFDTNTVILKGVTPNQSVIVSGTDKLTEGTPVSVTPTEISLLSLPKPQRKSAIR